MDFNPARQVAANECSIVFAISHTMVPNSGSYHIARAVTKLGSGLEVRKIFNQVYGLMSASLLEANYVSRFDGPLDIAKTRMDLTQLASQKDCGLSPMLDSNVPRAVVAAFGRANSRATQAITDLRDLVRYTQTIVPNKGKCFLSLKKEFMNTLAWAKVEGISVDNEKEVVDLLTIISQAEMVMIVDQF